MKRLSYFVFLIAFFLSGCMQSQLAPTSTLPAASSPTISSSRTATATKIPASQTPTPTTISPTATMEPIAVAPVPTHPLTLTEFNAGTQMKLLNVIGTGTAQDIEFSPDGQRLAIATGRGVFLYDGETFEQNGFLDVKDYVSAIAFSPDGNVLAVAVDGKVSLWNALSGLQMRSLDGGMVWVSKLAYGRGGYVAAIGGACRGCSSPVNVMILWNTETGQEIFSEHDIWYTTVALSFTEDGKELFFSGQRGLTAIESSTGELVTTYQTGGYDFVFNRDNTGVFVTSYGEDSKIFNFLTQNEEPFETCQVNITSNHELGACSVKDQILIFDLASGNELFSIDIDIGATYLDDTFALSPDSNFLAYYGKTGINVININTKEDFAKIPITDFDVADASIIEIDGTQRYALATLTHSGQVEVYDIQSNELLKTLQLDCCEIKGISFAPDRRSLATFDREILQLWDLNTGAITHEWKLKDVFYSPISFSSNGASIFLTNADNFVALNLQSGKTIRYGINSYAYGYANPYAIKNYNFNAQGNFVTFGYDTNNGRTEPFFKDEDTEERFFLPMEIIADFNYLEAFAFSSDGQFIATGNITDIFVWNLETLTLQATLSGHEDRSGEGFWGKIRTLEFNPQSNLLVSVGWDGTIRLWNAKFGSELRRLNTCCSADFTPDGRYLVTYGNGVAYVWGIP